MDRTLKALSDPTRRRMLRLLRGGDMTAGEIADRFPMTAPSVSHHLKVLKEAGLVDSERDGRNVRYSLNATVLQEVLEEVLEFFEVGAGEEGGEAAIPAHDDAADAADAAAPLRPADDHPAPAPARPSGERAGEPELPTRPADDDASGAREPDTEEGAAP